MPAVDQDTRISCTRDIPFQGREQLICETNTVMWRLLCVLNDKSSTNLTVMYGQQEGRDETIKRINPE